MSVKDMTDQQLNRKLAELMGYTVVRKSPNEGWVLLNESGRKNWYIPVCKDEQEAWEHVPDYCNDTTVSLKIQAKTIELDRVAYVNNLYEACYDFKRDEDSVWDEINIAFLLNASARQRAEAAYMTRD